MLIRINSRDAGRVTHTSLIFDCDPGVDDAVALFLAFAAQDRLELLGVTTVAGNVAAALTARNACVLRQIAGREDVPVIAGCVWLHSENTNLTMNPLNDQGSLISRNGTPGTSPRCEPTFSAVH